PRTTWRCRTRASGAPRPHPPVDRAFPAVLRRPAKNPRPKPQSMPPLNTTLQPSPPVPHSIPQPGRLAGEIERFDSFWEGPEDVEKGYRTFGQFYRVNYLPLLPKRRDSRILVVSCGPGYFVNLLRDCGYTDIRGIDSDAAKVVHARARGLDC